MQVRVRRRGRPSVALITAAAAAALGASCGSTGSHSQHGKATGSLVTARTVHRACSAAETKRIVLGVVRGFNRGDTKSLDRLVAQPPRFQWFSAPGPQARFGDAAARRSTLTEYARRRHRHRERLRIVRFGTSDQADGNFGLAIARHADDYHRRVVDAKGKVDCTGKTPALIVWSVGSDPATL